MESELFGHMRGSFTGATSDRKGAFREADGGTLFLDEIGDMDIAMQAKILRALQERIITPVGGKSVQVDVRVIAATHHDLGQRIHEGRFREDLFYRLNVAPIVLPPLWERTADIVPPPSSSQKYFEISSPLRGGASDSRGWSIRGGCGDRCRRRPVRRGDSFRAKRFGSWCRFPARRWIPGRRRGRGVRRGHRRGRGAKHRPVSVENRTSWSAVTTRPSRAAARRWMERISSASRSRGRLRIALPDLVWIDRCGGRSDGRLHQAVRRVPGLRLSLLRSALSFTAI